MSRDRPVPLENNEDTRTWREVVKAEQEGFSTRTYISKANETEINSIFTKSYPAESDFTDETKDFSDPWYNLTQSFFEYSDGKLFWAKEIGVPFVFLDEYLETVGKLVKHGDVYKLDVKADPGAILEHFLNPPRSLARYIASSIAEEASAWSVSAASRGGNDDKSETVRADVWSDAWLDNCSNKRLGQALQRDVGTFKLVSNGYASRKVDWGHFLDVAGPESKLNFVNTECGANYKGDSGTDRKLYGLSVQYGTGKKFVAEALIQLATDHPGGEFQAVYTQEQARNKWLAMHGDVWLLEEIWFASDPTYKRTAVKKKSPESNECKKRKASGESKDFQKAPAPVAGAPNEETTKRPTATDISRDMVSYIEALENVQTTPEVDDLAEHLIARADLSAKDIAKFLQVYADTQSEKAANLVSASSSSASHHPYSRSDLLEDILVAAVRKCKGVMNTRDSDHVDLFQFLAEKLMARGNPAAYNKEAWLALKKRLMETSYY